MSAWEARDNFYDFNRGKARRAGIDGSSIKNALSALEAAKVDSQMKKIDDELRRRLHAGEDIGFWFPFG